MSPLLAELEARLQALSHSTEAVEAIEEFASSFKNTNERLVVLNADGALIRAPIQMEEAQALGFNRPDDEFVILQGDLVRTDSAYLFGDRVVGRPLYVVLNASCDLVPGRRESALLLPLADVLLSDASAKSDLNLLTKYRRRNMMYLPPLPDDPPNVAGHAVLFDRPCQIRLSDLQLANRVASLSLVGWRMFGAIARTVVARANPREIEMRRAVG